MFKSLNSHILIFSKFFVNFTELTRCKEEYKISKRFGLVTDFHKESTHPGSFQPSHPPFILGGPLPLTSELSASCCQKPEVTYPFSRLVSCLDLS